jgi:hypothetical protein
MSDDQGKASGRGRYGADEGRDESDEPLRQRVEEGLARIIPDLIKRTIDAGIGTLSLADGGRLRSIVGDLKLPRDVARYFLAQVDDTKNALLKVFAREVREFLEHTDLADDLRKALTSVTLEVSTRVRFVPNDSAAGIGAEVESEVEPVRSSAPDRAAGDREDE